MNFIPFVCNISKDNFYNQKKNIVRIAIKFDDTDIDELFFDVPLVSVGIFKEPDWRFHKVLALFPEDGYKKLAIKDPTIPVGESNIIVPLGILIDASQYDKITGSIGNASFTQKCDAGTQILENLDFFIPAGQLRSQILSEDPNVEDLEKDIRTCGIAGARDGSIVLRSPGGEIILGQDGIRMTGRIDHADGNEGKTDIFNNNKLSFLPSTIVTILPERVLNVHTILNFGGIVANAAKFGKALMR